MSDHVTIAVWFCDECGYWRKEKSTGVHQTDDPNDPRGKLVIHNLRCVEFTTQAVKATGEAPQADGERSA